MVTHVILYTIGVRELMTEKSRKTKEATCEIEVAFSVIGGKWKP
jgi:hypothetical protein